MQKIIGAIILVGGICFSLYLGGWVMFVGGIAGLIDIIKAGDFEGITIAKNIAKIIFAGTGASIGIYLSIFTGGALMFKK